VPISCFLNEVVYSWSNFVLQSSGKGTGTPGADTTPQCVNIIRVCSHFQLLQEVEIL
jgi:hypothetical protein